MKHAILAAAITTLLVSAAPPVFAQTPYVFNDTTDPKLYLGLGTTDDVPTSALRLSFGQYTSDSTTFQLGSFDLVGANGGTWQWRYDNGTTVQINMDLKSDGVWRVLGAPVSGFQRSLEIAPGAGSITFSPATTGGSPVVLQTNGTGLNIGTSPIITQALGDARYFTQTSSDSRYLRSDLPSLTFGVGAIANGTNSVGLGHVAEALGNDSLAFGSAARAFGQSGVAIGEGTYSWGIRATALGSASGAQGLDSVAIGRDAWTDVAAEGSIAIGAGSRTYGVKSIAFGAWNNARGLCSMAVGGYANEADGDFSVAMGYGNATAATALESLAVGYQNSVAASSGTALGFGNVIDAAAWGGVALGKINRIHNVNAFAAGLDNDGFGLVSVALGASNVANGAYSLTVGHWNTTLISAYGSGAVGVGSQACGTSQFVVGSYNHVETDVSSTVRSDNDAAFIVGTGYQHDGSPAKVPVPISSYVVAPGDDHIERRNALVVRWNGNEEVAGNVISTATSGFSKFKAPVLVQPSGDISMGDFTAGTAP